MKLEITIPSTRIYLDTLKPDELDSLLKTRYVYNRAREELYNRKYDAEFLGMKLQDTAYIKRWLSLKFGFTPKEYYITSLQSHAGGMVSSQKELQKLRKAEYEERCNARKKKLKSLRRSLTLCRNSKESLISRSKKLKAGEPAPAPYIPKEFEKHLSGMDKASLCAYERWLTGEMKRLKAAIAQIEEKGRVDEYKQNRPPARIVFGGKDFYRKKDTTEIPLDAWHKERDYKRNKNILFCGRFDSPHKNWLVHFDYDSGRMEITLMDRTVLHLTDVRFPYRGNDLRNVLYHDKQPGWAVGYWMEFNTDRFGREYFLMKASISYYTDDRKNTFTGNGVIGVDINLDNLSWSELDGKGNRLHTWTYYFDIKGKTSTQIDDILGRACSRVIQTCVRTNKPLAMEDLDLTKKAASLAYGNKKANHGTRMFAYSKMSAFLTGKAARLSVGVIKVNPCCTSFIGKVKYMKGMKGTVHAAASYVIGRKALGLIDKIPAYLFGIMSNKRRSRSRYSQQMYLYNVTKEARTKVFKTQMPSFHDLKEFKAFTASA